MAEIKAFKGLRFSERAGKIGELACPPYDIISEEQRKAYLRTNGCNVIRLELPKEGENPYVQAGKTLQEWEKDGILAPDEKESLYIYEEEFTARGERKKIKGLICRVKIEEFSKGVILPHEETLSKAKADRFNLMNETFCNFSQIYSLYMDSEKTTEKSINSLSCGSPDEEFTDVDGVTHRLWIVSDKNVVSRICAQFKERKLYIADGHHRYETSLNFRNSLRERGLAKDGDPCDYVMMMLVNMENDGLVVFPTHRLVRNLKNFSREKVIDGCRDYFDISEIDGIENIEKTLDGLYSKGEKAFGFYCGGEKCTLLVLKGKKIMSEFMPDKSPASQGLDVSILHTLILERVMGIDKENMAKQINLTYTRDLSEAVEGVRNGDFQCSFILNPTRVTEIRDVAATGEKMPQKSTYFYPKLITGLVINKIMDIPKNK